VELRDTAKAADGTELAVTRFPAEGNAWGTLLVAGAMGVHQDFYEPLARFMAESGLHVLTFDYRGMGASREGSLADVKTPILGYSFEDDDIITRPAVDQLHGFYRAAQLERRHVRPADCARTRIGHVGYFLPASRGNLWKETLDWLRAKVSP
jgi:predicted alpha/beta hydrolase